MNGVIQQAKRIICEELSGAGYSVKRVLLFGSRARGNADSHSDWDFFVITDRDVPLSQWRKVSTRMRRRFVQAGFRGDVFFQSEASVAQRKNNPGYLTYYATKEGVEI